jgi:hypothetical protein
MSVEAVQIGELIELPMRVIVRPPCPNKTNGHWYCLTHQKGFANQFMKDTHISQTGKHKLVWVCHEHGPEAPE